MGPEHAAPWWAAFEKTYPTRAFRTGLALWRGGAVLDCDVQSVCAADAGLTEFTASGLLAESSGPLTTANVHVARQSEPSWAFQSDCRACGTSLCRHGAALLHSVAETDHASPVNGDLLDQRLAALDCAAIDPPAHVPSSVEIPESRAHLAYRLYSGPGHDAEICLEVVRINRHSRSQRVTTKPYHPPELRAPSELRNTLSYASVPRTEIDDDILARLPLLVDPMGTLVRLRGDDGAALLRRLLASGRCYWERFESAPLVRAPARQLTLYWQALDRTSQRLRCQLETLNHDWVLCPTDPPYYVDPRTLRCGEIQGIDRGAVVAQLSALPTVAASRLPETVARLVARLPLAVLPLPSSLAVQTIANVRPQPVLRLLVDKSAQVSWPWQAQLRFRYQSLELAPLAASATEATFHALGKCYYRIRRSSETEAQALAQVLALGFVPAENAAPGAVDWDPCLVMDAPSRSAQIRRWQGVLSDGLGPLQRSGWHIDLGPMAALAVSDGREWQVQLRPQASEDHLAMTVAVGADHQFLPLSEILSQVAIAEAHDRLADGQVGADQTVMVALTPTHWVKLAHAIVGRWSAFLTVNALERDPSDPNGAWRLPRAALPALIRFSAALEQIGQKTSLSTVAMSESLAAISQPLPVAAPPGLRATLRDYQLSGLSWLQFLSRNRLGGILADDMGLGKTVQCIAHLLLETHLRRPDGPVLVVTASSVIETWWREIERFAPDWRKNMTVLRWAGANRFEHQAQLPSANLVLTHYALLVRDKALWQPLPFHAVVLDEAQMIKNRSSQAARVAFSLQANHRLCMTGTPMENHLGELWSLFHFALPSLLGDYRTFQRRYQLPIENHDDAKARQQLTEQIGPYLLRRGKAQVAAELPAKTEVVETLSFGTEQRQFYDRLQQQLIVPIGERAGTATHRELFRILLRLRQACCDPRLTGAVATNESIPSVKLDWLESTVAEIIAEGRQVVVFSQFAKMLDLIALALSQSGIEYAMLTGRTRDRQANIDAFQAAEKPVFLVSLKAGGVGLNLTAADTVILYDPWWNPAVEQQAIDRAYRIGQVNPLFVYRLVVAASIEQRLLALQLEKRDQSDSLLMPLQSARPSVERLWSLLDCH